MKSKLNFLHVCDYVSFAEGGKLNIMGVFKNINAQKTPVVHQLMFVVLNFSIFKSGKYELILKILEEKNKIEVTRQNFNLNISIPKGKKKAEVGITGQLNNVKFENFGRYKIQALLDDDFVGEADIELIKT